MSGYYIMPKTLKELRALAKTFRIIFKADQKLYFPIEKLLDEFWISLPDFSYEIVTNDTFSLNIHADTNVKTGHIRIKESVYNAACEGNGRDRMTIAHELGHYLTLCFCDFKVQRNFTNKKIPAYADPEWQAKCFAGELMIPKELVSNLDVSEIMQQCVVSQDAAKYQKNIYRKEVMKLNEFNKKKTS